MLRDGRSVPQVRYVRRRWQRCSEGNITLTSHGPLLVGPHNFLPVTLDGFGIRDESRQRGERDCGYAQIHAMTRVAGHTAGA